MKLSFEAENICGQVSDFVLLGMEPATAVEETETHEGADGSSYIVIPLLGDAAVERWHVAITIERASVAPGECITQEAEMDYDPRELRWLAPDELRGRFLLKYLRWGDHELMKRPGAV